MGDASAILDEALDAGINLIDTANAHQDGRSKEVVSRAVR
jgi:aryl-alcohol dehydrogenase-like predicted oxidoreductase